MTNAKSNPNPTLPLETAVHRISCGQINERYMDNDWIMLGYKSSNGKVWANDDYFFSGQTEQTDSVSVDSTEDAHIFQTQRTSNESFHYEFPDIDPGRYLIRLYWADNSEMKNRLFSVSINGVIQISKLSVYRSADSNTQLTKEFWIDIKNETSIRIDFHKIVGSPFIQGIEIVKQALVVPQQILAPSARPGLVSMFYDCKTGCPAMTDNESNYPISYIEISDFFSNPRQIGLFRSSPFANQFVMHSFGFLRIPIAGNYTLFLESNGQSQLQVWSDQQKQTHPFSIVNNGGKQTNSSSVVVLFAQAAFYPITIRYHQCETFSSLRLRWVMANETNIKTISPNYFSHDQNDLFSVLAHPPKNETQNQTSAGSKNHFQNFVIVAIVFWWSSQTFY
jgi:hypothetical protein